MESYVCDGIDCNFVHEKRFAVIKIMECSMGVEYFQGQGILDRVLHKCLVTLRVLMVF